jgi:DNA polymerase (family 10)
LRHARECGCKIVINTDAHVTRVVGEWKYGIRQLRRAWLTPADILNTLPAGEFLASLRPRT